MNIETGTTTAATEAWNTAELGVHTHSLTLVISKSELAWAAALGFSKSVESLFTDFVSLFHIDDSVSVWAAGDTATGGPGQVLLAFFTAGVVIDHDDLFHLGKLVETRGSCGFTLLLARLTEAGHGVLDHF